jgi:hypothetical protein
MSTNNQILERYASHRSRETSKEIFDEVTLSLNFAERGKSGVPTW